MKQIIIRCDFCGCEKGESNHWFTLYLEKNGKATVLGIAGLHPVPISPMGYKDACGHNCVCQGVARFMDHGTLEER